MIEHWFSTPISFCTAALEVRQVTQIQYEKRRMEIEALLKHGTWADQIATTFDSCKNLIEQFELTVLKEFIIGQAAQLLHKKLVITESWVNYADKYAYQSYHQHEHEGLSGVYYLQTNGNDGKIKFHSPCPQLDRSMDAVTFTPEVGKIILFPGWLGHSVGANLSDDLRISIAFNVRET